MMSRRIRQCESKTAAPPGRPRKLIARVVIGVLGFLVLLLVETPCAAHAADPADFVRDLGREVSVQFGEGSLDQSERQRRFAALLDDVVDFDAIGALVLGARWGQASPTERSDFIREFRAYLVHNFAGRLHGFADHRLTVIDMTEDGDAVILRTEIGDEGKALPVEWRLTKRDGGWRLCDLALDHFSLAAILRAQFSDILDRPGGGFAALLLLLHEKATGP